jgi:anaerobic magnesium-protoporphyrin IX monomethyl ester cyclase
MNVKIQKQKSEIILITPPSPVMMSRFFLQTTNLSPLGIGYIAAVLQDEGFRVNCLNLTSGLTESKNFEHYITQTNPKIVGISTMTETYQNGLLLAKLVKKVNPDVITVLGGPHVTFMSEEALSNDCVNIAVRREGEYTMLELAKYFIRNQGSLKDIKGIVYKSNGTIVRTAVRPLLEDLDTLPYPLRNIPDLDGIINSDSYKMRSQIITSRGCPGRCKFCAAAALSGGRYRMRSINNIAGELMSLKTKGTNLIFFVDDTVSADISRLLELCSLTKELRIMWGAECRVDAMTEDLAKALKDSGCIALQFGVESGSQEMLDRMRKGITLQQIEQAVKWVTDAKLTAVCSLMIGTPEDTITTIKQTTDFGIKLQQKYGAVVIMAIFIPFPGTYYYNHIKELGISITTHNFNQFFTINSIIDTPHLTHWQIRNAYFDCQSQLLQSLPENYKSILQTHVKHTFEKAWFDLPLDKS